MPGYIAKALHKFWHPTYKQPQRALHDWTAPACGSRVQYAQTETDPPTLDPAVTQSVQYIAGNLLYYYRALNLTMITALNEISTQQLKPTVHTITKCNRLLDYAAT